MSDDKDIVILMIDQKVTPAVVKGMVQGKADPINSAFHLTYNMVLNLLRVEEINPEYMLERSFFQFQNQAAIPDLIDKVRAKQKEYDMVSVEQEHSIASYCNIRSQLDLLAQQFRSFITRPEYLKPFLQPGRLVKVKTEKHEYDWGIIVNFRHKTDKKKRGQEVNPLDAEAVIIVDILLHVKKADDGDPESNVPCPPGEAGDVEVVPVLHTLIYQISSLRVYYPKDLRPADSRKSVLKTINEVKKRFPEGPPLLNPIKDMKIEEPVFKECVERIKQLEERLYAHPMHTDKNRTALTAAYERKLEIYDELQAAKTELRKAKSILQMEELKKRKRVLRRMGYCTAADVIELKGRIACELSRNLKLANSELRKAKSILQMEELKKRKRVLRRMGYCTAADVIELKGRIACELSRNLQLAKTELRKAKSILQMEELKKRKRVLRRMGYCTAADVIELKGRIACELSR
ncbi:rRNA-processing arch domain-containing protein [Phthorimaea operculella]|nr:rRNA-processing arch domain-containing protein [Phthorimaea operculella]